ncbi:MAG TPA: alpha/beta hydrolase [Terriglobia bacterium]|nr:alpha/beta hydrolase [Terriglobia bacterium]
MRPGVKRWISSAAKIGLPAILVLVIAGMIYEKVGERKDRGRYPQIGRSVDIGGRTLNIYCSGEGGPTVVSDTFGHAAGYSWSAVQREVAKFSGACWYDRAAYGWSEPAPIPRTFKDVVEDLHALLHDAGVPPPYVLVGAGDAASHLRVYHGLYPSEVAGVVMLNANGVDDPRAAALYPENAKGGWAREFGSFAPRVRAAACTVFPLLARSGLNRLLTKSQKPRRTTSFGLTPAEQTELDFLSDNPTAVQGSELCAREKSMQQVEAAGSLGAIPLLVLAPEYDFPEKDSVPGSTEAAWNKYQREQVQPGLARLSTQGKLMIENHPLTAAMIVDAVRQVVTEVRATHQK